MKKRSRMDIIGQNGNDGLHYVQSVFHDNAEFQRAGDVKFPEIKNAPLQERLMKEEYDEWMRELEYGSESDIKEALDLMYVTAGYLNALLGPDKALLCWDALHKNNMSKCTDGKLLKRNDGKILKHPDYKPLSLKEILCNA